MSISKKEILQGLIRVELNRYIDEMMREEIRGQLQRVVMDDTACYHEEWDMKRVISEAVKEYLTPQRVEQIIKTLLKD